MKAFTIVICLLAAGHWATAQGEPERFFTEEPQNKGKAILFHLNMGGHLPAGDMAKRFGNSLALGSGLEYISANNWIVGGETHYLFSQSVKEDPLTMLRTPEGEIIGKDQSIASVVLRERGWYAGFTAGKLFAPEERRSGLRLTLGVGYLRHKIRVQDDGNTVLQLTGDYLKGYDRLTGGIALQQFIGWQHLGAQRRSNWFAGLEFNQGFTQSLRDWDFAAMKKLEGSRADLRFGFRIGWTLPFYPKAAERIYY